MVIKQDGINVKLEIFLHKNTFTIKLEMKKKFPFFNFFPSSELDGNTKCFKNNNNNNSNKIKSNPVDAKSTNVTTGWEEARTTFCERY